MKKRFLMTVLTTMVFCALVGCHKKEVVEETTVEETVETTVDPAEIERQRKEDLAANYEDELEFLIRRFKDETSSDAEKAFLAERFKAVVREANTEDVMTDIRQYFSDKAFLEELKIESLDSVIDEAMPYLEVSKDYEINFESAVESSEALEETSETLGEISETTDETSGETSEATEDSGETLEETDGSGETLEETSEPLEETSEAIKTISFN